MNLFKEASSDPSVLSPRGRCCGGDRSFGRMTLHQQAALLRLCSRNLIIEIAGELHMGYDFDWDVDAAMIVARPSEAEFLLGETSDTP